MGPFIMWLVGYARWMTGSDYFIVNARQQQKQKEEEQRHWFVMHSSLSTKAPPHRLFVEGGRGTTTTRWWDWRHKEGGGRRLDKFLWTNLPYMEDIVINIGCHRDGITLSSHFGKQCKWNCNAEDGFGVEKGAGTLQISDQSQMALLFSSETLTKSLFSYSSERVLSTNINTFIKLIKQP